MLPLCPSSEHTWVLLRRDVHRRFIKRQIEALDGYFALLASDIDTNGVRYLACLSCAIQGAQPVREVITFDQGDAVSRPSADSVLSALDRDAERIVVNGHACSDEPDGDSLSQIRADRVRARLLELGYAPHRVEARGRADAVPLENGSSRVNRRVDFDLGEIAAG